MALATSRTIEVLEALGDRPAGTSLAEIVSATGIGRASASRLLAPLIEAKAVVVEGDPARYRLGLRCWNLGVGALRPHSVVEISRPYLMDLARTLGTRINFALPEADEMVFIQSVDFRGRQLTVEPIYVRRLMLATASGRVVAAYAPNKDICRWQQIEMPKFTPFSRSTAEVVAEFPEIRRAGFAATDREQELELSGVAVPLRDRSGAAVAALGLPLIGPLREEFTRAVIPAALDCAGRISSELGFESRHMVPLV